jgi:hypothetical protein
MRRPFAVIAALSLMLPPAQAGISVTAMQRDASNASLPMADANLGLPAVYGKTHGMKCDGASDDTAALQASVNAAQAYAYPATANGGAVLELPPGFCLVSSAIAITAPLTIRGAGPEAGSGVGNSGGTVVRTTSATADVFTATVTSGIAFDNFRIDTTTTTTAGAGINLTGSAGASQSSQISRMAINGMWNGIQLGDAQSWKIVANRITQSRNDGVLYTASATYPDGSGGGGSSALYGNTIWNNGVADNAGIEIQGGGDVEISGNKLIGHNYGLLLNATQGPTGTLLSSNNSLEENGVADIALLQAVAGKNYDNVTIEGNQFSNLAVQPTAGQIVISAGTPAAPDPKWIQNVAIVGNVFNNAITNGTSAIAINDGNGIIIADNAINNRGAGSGGTGIATAAAATNVVIHGNRGYSNAGTFQLFGAVYWPNVDVKEPPAPNLLLNGGLDLDQANEGASIAASAGGNTFTADGWKTNASDSSSGDTIQQITDAPQGAQHSIKLTVGTGSGAVTAAQFFRLAQWIEANNLRTIGFGTPNAQPLSLSLQVKSSVTGTFGVAIENNARNRSYALNCTVSQAATWTPCSWTIPGDTSSGWTLTGTGIGMILQLSASCGSNFQGTAGQWNAGEIECTGGQTQLTQVSGATLQISNVKLEVSPNPTPFVAPDVGAELQRAQRLYAKTLPQGTKPAQNGGLAGALCAAAASTTAGTWSVYWPYRVEMRVSPTITTYNPAAANANIRDVSSSSDATVLVDAASAKSTTGVMLGEQTTALTAAHNLCIHATADARL